MAVLSVPVIVKEYGFCLTTDSIQHGWETIEAIHLSDLSRARRGVSRRVPDLKYSYVERDAWTKLNVHPAKIMQVKLI